MRPVHGAVIVKIGGVRRAGRTRKGERDMGNSCSEPTLMRMQACCTPAPTMEVQHCCTPPIQARTRHCCTVELLCIYNVTEEQRSHLSCHAPPHLSLWSVDTPLNGVRALHAAVRKASCRTHEDGGRRKHAALLHLPNIPAARLMTRCWRHWQHLF